MYQLCRMRVGGYLALELLHHKKWNACIIQMTLEAKFETM
jgi:hypothetical protein